MTKEELRASCTKEFENVRGIVEAAGGLAAREDLDLAGTAALGAFILSAYTGMERVLERVLLFDSIAVRNTESRHSEILRKAHEMGIAPHELHTALSRYLGFREFFSRAYITELDREKLLFLAEGLPDTLAALEREVFEYIETI